MRLHRLRLEAFGPFASEQEIDFDRLGASGLFLLEGPTGAGKTSILDAITFALYGGLAGRHSGSDRLHSHFADAGVEPFVELEFSVRGRRYRIRRTPEWDRPRRRSPGTTRQKPSVHLERQEAVSGWVSRSAGKAEVGELIEDLLGLNRAQFTQVALLPQGEFADFLRAGDDERRALLTKIFDAHLYDEITAELSERRAAAQAAVDAAEQRTVEALAAAAEAAGLDPHERDELVAGPISYRGAALAALEESLGQAAGAASAAESSAAAALAAARTAAIESGRRHDLSQRYRAATGALATHLAGRPAHLVEAGRLRAGQHAAAVRPLVVLLDERTETVVAARDRLGALAPGRPELLDGTGSAELLRHARDREAIAAQLAPAIDREADLPRLRDSLTEAQEVAAAAAKRVAQLEDRRAELPDLVRQARDDLQAARDAAAAVDGLADKGRELRNRLSAATALAEADEHSVALAARRRTIVDAHQAAVDAHQEALEARLAGMAAELAGALRDGEPCAVCGSPDHPAPARPAVGSAAGSAARPSGATAVAAAERARRAAEAARVAIDDEGSAWGAHVAALRAVAGDQSPAALAGQLEFAEQAAAEAARHASGLAEAEARLTEREVELGRWQAAMQDAAQLAAAARAQADTVSIRLATIEEEVAKARGGEPSVSARRVALLTEAASAQAVADAVDELSRALTELAATTTRAEQVVTAGGFASVSAARSAAMADAALTELADRVAGWEATANRLRMAAEHDEFAAVVDLDPTAVADEQQRATAALREADGRHAAARSLADATNARAERFAVRRQEVDLAGQTVDRARAAGADAIHLAGVARGVAGARRTNLTTYVLRRWFDQVVSAANLRLAAMSSGRYVLVRTDVGARAVERAGLTVRVLDQHTGEQRSTASMSGGETFYTSLALALGLADVVAAEAGGVELDTLFIDEGFGSLDAETLDEVMAVVDELRDHGRVVGIVSHVAELKHRVPERISVRRQRNGASSLEVLA